MYTARNGHQCSIVAIEGPDRVGKATQAKLLEEALTIRNRKATVEEIPYNDGVTYKQIYAMLHSGAVNQHPVIFQTLQATNRRIFQKQYLPTLAIHYEVVILDRWNLSTRVYGEASGVPKDATDLMLDGILEPDVTLVFDGKPFPKEGLDVWEADLEFQRKVRGLYIDAVTFGRDQGLVKIEAAGTKEEIHEKCLGYVLSHLR